MAAKDTGKNVIYVTTDKAALLKDSIPVGNANWISSAKFPVRANVKIRYRNQSLPATIIKKSSDNSVLINFLKPARAIAPGQSAVFYRGAEVLGGGIIK